MKISAVIPIRTGSQRVRDKNLRPFADTTLLDNKIKNLLQVEELNEIIVNTNSEELLERISTEYANSKVRAQKREEYYASSQCSGSEFFQHLGEVMEAVYVGENERVGKHWGGVNLSHVKPTHPWRYFNEEEVRRSELRRKIENLPIEEQNKRNNIEAAMFQYSFHARNGKTRYRGLFRHRLQAFHRCMWMNLRGLVLFQTTINQRPLLEAASTLMEKVCNHIYSLMGVISDPMKVFREYLTLLAEISVWPALKPRFSVSKQMFNLKDTF